MDSTPPSANATAPPPIIKLISVSMQFGAQRVLDHITLDIERNQTLAVIGESGCGKTVLLKLLIGLVRPTVGEVLFDGHDLQQLNETELMEQRMRIGFLFQGAALFDSMSVFDNVAFGLRHQHRMPERLIRDRVLQRLQEVGLPPGVEAKMPGELSGGMKKRVGLARALALDPEVMLYDEPTTGLDPVMSAVIDELVVQTARRGAVTTVVVTHDMNTVRKVADRVVMLAPYNRLQSGQWQVLFDGTVAELSACTDPQVHEFVQGEAQGRMQELARTLQR
jgi:phospholipid/cholesterol/gamma-HCH transport system ATP-binding protein